MNSFKNIKFLIVVATLEEINPLLSKMTLIETCTPQKKIYSHGNKKITLIIAGIGMVNTCYWLTKSLMSENYNLVINAGIAGSFNKEIKLGEVVIVEEEKIADLGAEDHDDFLDIVKLGLTSGNEFPFINNSLMNNNVYLSESLKQLKKVKGISVNKVHGNQKSIDQIKQHYNADVESMEGAAVFYTCLQEKIQFVEIRAISNYVEPRDKSKWQIGLAIENLNELLLKFIGETHSNNFGNGN